jgi:hypothetical protein
MAYRRPHGLFGFGIERVVGQFIGVEEGSDRLETRHASRDVSGSVSSTTYLNIFFAHIFHLVLQLNQVSDRRSVYLGTAYLFCTVS